MSRPHHVHRHIIGLACLSSLVAHAGGCTVPRALRALPVASGQGEGDSAGVAGLAPPGAPAGRACDIDRRLAEEEADGVPRSPCEADPYSEEQIEWTRKKRFVRRAVAPAPGRPAVGRYRAPWCLAGTNDTTSAIEVRRAIDAALSSATGADRALFAGLERAPALLCVDPDEPRFQELAGAYMQLWVNATGASLASVEEYIAQWRNLDARERLARETCARWDDLSTRAKPARALGALTAPVFGCSVLGEEASLWHLDAQATPSALAMMTRIDGCLLGDDPTSGQALAAFAACRPELPLLDRARLDAELEAGGYNPWARASAHFELERLLTRVASYEAALTRAVGSDAALAAVLVDAPAKGWAEWHTTFAAHRKELEGARAYEATWYGNSKAAKRGCLSGTVRAFSDHVRTRPWKSVEGMTTVATSAVGAVLAEQVRQCAEAEDEEALATTMQRLIRSGMPRRGPRMAVLVAMQTALREVLADRERFAIDMTWLAPFFGDTPFGMGEQLRIENPAGGTVASLEPRGSRALLTFAVESWSEDEVECQDTGKVIGVRPDGTFMYGQTCRATGRSVTRTSGGGRYLVPAAMTAGIRKGVHVELATRGTVDGIVGAVPVEVWTDKGRTRLLAAYGVAAP